MKKSQKIKVCVQTRYHCNSKKEMFKKHLIGISFGKIEDFTDFYQFRNDANSPWTSIQLKARLGSKIHKKKLRNVGGRNARTELGKLEKFWLGEDRHLFWSDTMG
jgi:hypothetical protein